MYILLHFESNLFMRNCALYLINYIERLNGKELFKARINPSARIISFDEEIIIDFRCGKEPDKLAGLRPDIYYSDVEEVANFLRLYADKQNGVRIHEIVHVKHLLLDYILHKKLAPALDNAFLYGTEGKIMIRLEHVVLPSPDQMDFIIEGMRNPMNSWDKSDSYKPCMNVDGYCEICEHTDERCSLAFDSFEVGNNDMKLMRRLAAAGTEHRKYMRMMPVYVRITAPLYWWKEFDTYKVGTVANSCSTMHKVAANEFELSDFSCEHLYDANHKASPFVVDKINPDSMYSPLGILKCWVIPMLNEARGRYLAAVKTESETGLSAKDIWWQMIQLLPSSYNQTRNVMLNYEVLADIYRQRKNHKLDEWVEFCKWIKSLPHSEIITGGENNER